MSSPPPELFSSPAKLNDTRSARSRSPQQRSSPLITTEPQTSTLGGAPILGDGGKKRKSSAKPRASTEGGMEIDDEIEGLLLQPEGEEQVPEEEQEKRIPPPGDIKCEWAECDATFAIPDDLVTHVKEDHINQCKESFICEWRTCPRLGQKQASKHSLMTHSRMHTGERPYACSAPGCTKTFTRSDALNKHVRSQHNPDAPPPTAAAGPSTPSISGSGPAGKSGSKRSGPAAAASSSTLAYASDSDLMLDEDIAEVLPRIRKREALRPDGEDEKAAMAYIRGMHPREEDDGGKGKSKKTNTSSRKPKSSQRDKAKDDPFPESLKYVHPLDSPPSSTPASPVLQSTTLDPDEPDGEMALFSRSRWQIRYVRVKARMMLVEEENRMRRKELEDLLFSMEQEGYGA